MPFFGFSLFVLHCPTVGRKELNKAEMETLRCHGVMKIQPG